MIELNKKTQQDFLNREWVQRLLDAGVDMSDAKYQISKHDGIDFIRLKPSFLEKDYFDSIPTYTVSELLYKLHEWIYPTIDGREYGGGLTFCKDAPFYIFYYDLTAKPDREGYVPVTKNRNAEYIRSGYEYPIESLASVLIQCHKKDIGIPRKDVGSINSK